MEGLELGKLAVEKGIISEQQLDECTKEISNNNGDYKNVISLLIHKKYLNEEQLVPLLNSNMARRKKSATS